MNKFKLTREFDFLKVAQICPQYYPHLGGVEYHVAEISRRLKQKGFEIEVLTTDPTGELPKEETIDNLKVRRFRSYAPNGNYYFSKELKRYLAHNSCNYDLLHAHNYHALPALYAARAKGKHKFVFTPHYHGKTHSFFRNLLHVPYAYKARFIFNQTDRIVCVSRYERNLLIRNFKIDEGKAILIPNGIDVDGSNFSSEKNPRKTILYVGRIEKYKGIHYLIKVLLKLDGSISLDIVGSGSYLNTLIKLTRSLDINYRVNFYKDLTRSMLLRKYSDAALFVTLSTEEAFGLSVGEALALGVPCIVANSSALIDWVDNENCFCINYPIDIDKLARLINSVIGRKTEKQIFPTWDDVTDQLIELYKDIIN